MEQQREGRYRDSWPLMTSGLNLHKRDNLYQGLFVLFTAVVGASIGGVLADEEVVLWALTGVFYGLVAGVFVSGLVIMVYRAVRRPSEKDHTP